MNTLEHFQDNLNQNIDNGHHLEQFIKHANVVRDIFITKYRRSGSFLDPAKIDPKNK